MIDPHAPTKRRRIISRTLLVVVAILAAWVASTKPSTILAMVAWAFSIAASGLFPALVMGIWWKRTTNAGAVAGMIAGYGVCLYYLITTQFYGAPLWFGIKNISRSEEHTYELQSLMRNSYAVFCLKQKK